MVDHRVSHRRQSVQGQGELINKDEKIRSDIEAMVKAYGSIGAAGIVSLRGS